MNRESTLIDQPEALSEALTAAIATHSIPGAAVAIYHRGQTIEAAAGLANAAAGIAADVHTVFQIGSISKAFTATLAVLLAERGVLDLEAPVARYLPTFRIARAPVSEALTVRTLLDYSSGFEGDFFRDFGAGDDALARYVSTCEELLQVHAPGAMRSYNSTAYCVAGRVIEVVTGRPFNAVLADELLGPMGIERYGFYTHDVLRYRTAVGHTRLPNGGFAVANTLRLPHCMSAAGASLTMSARDLLQFARLHLGSGRTETGTQLLTPEGIASMSHATRRVPPGDAELLLGWATLPTDAGPLVIASGRTIEQNAFVFLLPGHEFAAALLTNCRDGGERLFLDLGARYLKGCTGATFAPPAPPPPPAGASPSQDLENYAGTYRNSYVWRIVAQAGALEAVLEMQDGVTGAPVTQAFRLAPLGGDRFVACVEDAPALTVEFLDGQRGCATYLAAGGRVYLRQ